MSRGWEWADDIHGPSHERVVRDTSAQQLRWLVGRRCVSLTLLAFCYELIAVCDHGWPVEADFLNFQSQGSSARVVSSCAFVSLFHYFVYFVAMNTVEHGSRRADLE